MKIAIVEDNIDDINWLKKLLEEYDQKFPNALRIDYYNSGKQLIQHLHNVTYNLVIMDIYMDDMDGIETANRLMDYDETTLVAFVTTSEDEIWRAVTTHGCFDYIQKQFFDFRRLEKLMRDVYKKLKIQGESLVFYNGRQEIILRLDEIQYIVSNDKYTVFTLKEQVCKYRITFSQVCELLKYSKRFIVCNRGIMLNMQYILKTDGDIFQMADTSKFPIRRKGRREIIDAFHDFQFQKLDSQEVFG